MSFGGVTYLAILVESSAADADAQYVVDSTLVQSRELLVDANVAAEAARAGTYRRMMAEADAVAEEDPASAAELRVRASAYAGDSGLVNWLTGTPAEARFLREDLAAAWRHQSDGLSVAGDQPRVDRERAAALHRHAQALAGYAAAMLTVGLVTTLTRVASRRRARVSLAILALSGYLVTVTEVTLEYLASR